MTALVDIAGLGIDLPLPRNVLGALRPRRRLNLIDGITLTVGAGETLGLVGESGSGKTTLARALIGLVPLSRGDIRFRGAPVKGRAGWAAMRRQSAMMFQDATASLSPRMTVGALLSEPFAIHGQSAKGRAEDLLSRVGLPPALLRRYPHELSGGQARRVSVARALALDPAFVIADEPTAGLDVSIQGEVLNLLADLKARLGLSLLIITHNLAMVRHVADRIAILYLGRLMEVGPTTSVFAAPAHPYTASLIASEPQPDPRKRRANLAIRGEIPSVLNRPTGCVFHTRCPKATAVCRIARPETTVISDGWQVNCHHPNTQQGG